MSAREGDDGAWTAIAMTLVDGVFEAPDRTAAVDRILGILQSVAGLTLVLMIGAAATGHVPIALALVLVMAACVLRMGVFWIRMRRADPSDPAVLPTASQLLALQCVRVLPEG